jgi:hypothetical protein
MMRGEDIFLNEMPEEESNAYAVDFPYVWTPTADIAVAVLVLVGVGLGLLALRLGLGLIGAAVAASPFLAVSALLTIQTGGWRLIDYLVFIGGVLVRMAKGEMPYAGMITADGVTIRIM